MVIVTFAVGKELGWILVGFPRVADLCYRRKLGNHSLVVVDVYGVKEMS